MSNARALTLLRSSNCFIYSHYQRSCAPALHTHQTSLAIAEMLYIQRRDLSSHGMKTWNIRALPKGMSRFNPSTLESPQTESTNQKAQLEKRTLNNAPRIDNRTMCLENSPVNNREANADREEIKNHEKEIDNSDNSNKDDNNAHCDIDRSLFARNIRHIHERKQNAITSKTIEFVQLPPWPIDSIEYNTRAENGGHDKRLAFERQVRKEVCGNEGNEKELNVFDYVHKRNIARSGVDIKCKSRRNTLNGSDSNNNNNNNSKYVEEEHEEEEEEEEEESEVEVGKGGTNEQSKLLKVKNNVCDHDEENQEEEFQHIRVADEIRSQPVGRIINVRNRFNRWTCTSCKEINSLQATLCRHCANERFNITLRCTYCNGMTQLNNKLVYGSELCDSAHYTMNFGVHNCFARLSPEMKCVHCRKSLHGAAVELDGRRSWWCACGCCSHNIRPSCMRCRLPRSIPLESILHPLLQHKWDFRDSSCWYCEGCDGVNRASRYVVALFSPLARQLMREHQSALRSRRFEASTNDLNSSSSTNNSVNVYPDADLERGFLRSYGVGQDGLRKEARLISGDVSCRHCGLPWHHQLLRNGSHWRCACHALNSAEDTQCKVCELPALDTLSANVISLWHHGDWYCTQCHRHCYRLRPQCICGARRVALPQGVN